MPIIKTEVVHKFGIFSQTHQSKLKERLKQKCINDSQKRKSYSPVKLSSLNSCGLEKLFYQLSTEEDELKITEIQEKLNHYLQKLKFQLSSNDFKNGFSVLESCWKDLFFISTTENAKLRKDALLTLETSLVSSPLSKKLLNILIEIGLGYLQLVYIDEQVNSFNNRLLLKVTLLVFSRLHYHYLIKDINESFVVELQSIDMINDGLKHLLKDFEDNPVNYLMLKNITSVVDFISDSIVECENLAGAKEDSNDGSKVIQFLPCTYLDERGDSMLVHSLHLWHCISRQLPVKHELLHLILSSNMNYEPWLDSILALKCLSECAKLNIPYLLVLLEVGGKSAVQSKTTRRSPPQQNKSNCHSPPHQNKSTLRSPPQPCYVGRPNGTDSDLMSPETPCDVGSLYMKEKKLKNVPSIIDKIDDFLNNDKAVKVISRNYIKTDKLTNHTTDITDSTNHDTADPEELINHTTDITDSTNHDKADMDDLTKDITDPTNKNLECSDDEWCWPLTAFFLHCLAEIIKYGLTTEVKKIALVGLKELYGLVHYLNEDWGWQVQYTSYQLLYDLYNYLKNTDDGLNNTIWYHLSKYEERRRDSRVLRVIKHSEKGEEICDGKLYSKISTNLCIVLFSESLIQLDSLHSPDVSLKPFTPSQVNPGDEVGTCFPSKRSNSSKQQVAKKSFYLPEKNAKSKKTIETLYDIQSASERVGRIELERVELGRVVSDQFHKEVREDEIERSKLLINEDNV